MFDSQGMTINELTGPIPKEIKKQNLKALLQKEDIQKGPPKNGYS